MPIPDGARRALARRLDIRRQERWPDLLDISIRYRGSFAYVEGVTRHDGSLPLCRLRYLGSPHNWGFAIYLASKDGYEDAILPRGTFTGAAEEALDCACGLYLNDVGAWGEAQQSSPDSRNYL
jgi:hypothetical protein